MGLYDIEVECDIVPLYFRWYYLILYVAYIYLFVNNRTIFTEVKYLYMGRTNEPRRLLQFSADVYEKLLAFNILYITNYLSCMCGMCVCVCFARMGVGNGVLHLYNIVSNIYMCYTPGQTLYIKIIRNTKTNGIIYTYTVFGEQTESCIRKLCVLFWKKFYVPRKMWMVCVN